MSGTDRLRALAGAWDEWGLGGSLTEIADEIERELDRQDEVVDYDELLDAIDRRLMPEGIEWPRYESGELVQIGDDVTGRYCDDPIKVRSVVFRDDFVCLRERFESDRAILVYPGERVKHPAPAVLAADGEPLEVGQTVWDVESGEELKVEKLCDVGLVRLLTRDGVSRYVYPDQLTHTKPEIDTWQRIEEDAGCTATKYNERRGTIFTTKQQVARDLVRRCKALAERERGE